MRRTWVATVVLAALVAVGALLLPGVPEVEALVPSQVVGQYKLRLRGEGGVRDGDVYQDGRIRERAILVLSHAEGDAASDQLDVQIRLLNATSGSLLQRGTPQAPQFRARGVLVGNSLALIDTGTSGFANVISLRFTKNAKKVSGAWISALPAESAATGPLVSVHVEIAGKRLRPRRFIDVDRVSSRQR